jgi:hypothetical protein
MDFSPLRAQCRKIFSQHPAHFVHLGQSETEALAQLRWAAGAIQNENGFACRTDDMDVRGAMVVWPNDDAKTIHTFYDGHGYMHRINPSGLE